MKLAALRSAANAAIRARLADAGDNYIVDHADGTLYLFSVWANEVDIAFDARITRRDACFKAEYQRACAVERASRTVHYPQQ